MSSDSTPEGTAVRWVDGAASAVRTAPTWGLPWPRGRIGAGASFAVRDDGGTEVAAQSAVLATWPDGSLKWSRHRMAPGSSAQRYHVVPGREPAAPERAAVVRELPDGGVAVDTGPLRLSFAGSGAELVTQMLREGRETGRSLRWTGSVSTDHEPESGRHPLTCRVDSLLVEEEGAVAVVVRQDGVLLHDGRALWEFRARSTLSAGSDAVRLVTSLIWTGSEQEATRGLGLTVQVPMRAEPHDRHLRIAGEEGGLWDAVRGLTGMPRSPGEEVVRAQVAGVPTPPVEEWAEKARRVHRHVPTFSDWTLSQLSPDGYTVRKRTGPGRGWVGTVGGTRSLGSAFLGDVHGGVSLGMRDFWQRFPTQMDVRGAATETAELTSWLYSPEALPMDLRHYRDLPEEVSRDEFVGRLEAVYEDTRPENMTAHGIGRTHEFLLRVHDAVPTAEEFLDDARATARPPQLVADPERLHAAGTLGVWSPASASPSGAAELERTLRSMVDFTAGQVEQRRWYGFWDHGDVMHSYDPVRHEWRFDVGGCAWDNSELSTDLWLWTQFLRTGDPTTYRLAEAMTRHTGDVDCYHRGPWRGFGSRHNVQHWGCGCVQLRVSSAVYRRIHHFLTGDEHTGDLLDELEDTERVLAAVHGSRGGGDSSQGYRVSLGTDYGALLALWLTRWERHGDTAARDAIVTSLASIGRNPQGFLAGEGHLDPSTFEFRFLSGRMEHKNLHLQSMFGLPEILDEVLDLIEDPQALAAVEQFALLYFATEDEQVEELGAVVEGTGFRIAHSRLLARVAARRGDASLAVRAWQEFLHGHGDRINRTAGQWTLREHGATTTVRPGLELPFLTTNDIAQAGLSAIQLLALVPRATDHYLPGPDES